MKKVLVTGGAGFIGSNLIKELSKKKYNIVCLDNYSTGNSNNEAEGVKYINADITTIDSLDTDFDLCFHLAAQSRVQPSFENPEESFRVNVFGTTKVMEFAKKKNIRVVYAGSSSKHHGANAQAIPVAWQRFLETIQLHPNHHHSPIVRAGAFASVRDPRESIQRLQ